MTAGAPERNPLRRLWAWLTRANERRALLDTGLRASGFWCSRHLQMLDESGASLMAATAGITVGLRLLGIPPGPTKYACCNFTDATVKGVLARSVI